ncbi:MAG: ABC transporter permease [Trueperaceae bacterium]|nr:ABC transporter permease [Trueperaceae bacterium]
MRRTWRWERRGEVGPAWTWAVSLGAVGVAIVLTGVLFAAFGVAPLPAFAKIVERTLMDGRGLSEVVRRSIPLMLAGVGLALAFRARFWNIGAEGQLLMGGVAASGVALFSGLPGLLLLPAMFLAGFAAGAAWGLGPALLRVRLGVNEIITTLMLNYVAIYLVRWLINGPWKGRSLSGFAYSDRFDAAAWLPTLGTTRLHWPTLLLAIALAVLVAWLLARTRFGFEVRMIGESREAARYAGVDFFKTTLALVLISAGAAGLAGVGEVAGIHHRLVDPNSLSVGYGYTAIIVALLARRDPLASLVTAAFLGWVAASGDVMQVALGLPSQITGVTQGLVLLVILASEPLLRYRLRRVPRAGPAGGAPDAAAGEAR